MHSHHLITPEIRRELFSGANGHLHGVGDDDDDVTVFSKKSVKSTISGTNFGGRRVAVEKDSMMDI